MITKRAQNKINDLICAISDRVNKAATSGNDIPLNAVDSLSRLIEVASGAGIEADSPVCGFIVPLPSEDNDDEV